MTAAEKTGIYIHWPFCASKCPYCDFNSHVHESIDQNAWRQAYLRAIEHYAEKLPGRVVSSVFFGGGTPSLMEPETVAEIFDAIQKHFKVANDLEVTLEANPTSVEAEKFKAFRAAGVNRVSIGVQALNDKDLKFLGRTHSVKNAVQAIETARENFQRFSFDLIYARPEQTLKDWKSELIQALEYTGGHLSLYQLTIERNTPFYMSEARGEFKMPKEELAADFYNLTQDVLEENGLAAYEVSNHARPGQESVHNMIYWNYDDYIGIGPGAHGRLTMGGKKFATREHSAPLIWLDKVQEGGSGAHPYAGIAPQDRFFEALMMGLRLREGLPFERLEAQTGRDWRENLDQSRMDDLSAQGWLVYDETHMSLTREGVLRLNAIIPHILK